MKTVGRFINIFLIGLVFGCTPEQSTSSEYIIENGLEMPITLRFFRNGTPSSKTSPVQLETLKNRFNKSAETLGSSTSPFDVFGADSIVVIFNGERFQGHNLFEPTDFSLLNQDDYEIVDDERFIYIIGQKNLDASTNCTDNCD